MPVRKLIRRTLGSSHAVLFDRYLLYCVRGGRYPNRRLSEPTLAGTLRFRFSETRSAKEEKSLTSWFNT